MSTARKEELWDKFVPVLILSLDILGTMSLKRNSCADFAFFFVLAFAGTLCKMGFILAIFLGIIAYKSETYKSTEERVQRYKILLLYLIRSWHLSWLVN